MKKESKENEKKEAETVKRGKIMKREERKVMKEAKRIEKLKERSFKIRNRDKEKKGGGRKGKKIVVSLFFSLLVSIVVFYFIRTFLETGIAFAATFILLTLYFFLSDKLKKVANIRKMEDSFPDFIGLMASNLRAGMTVDRALLLSSRKEFAPLDEEIMLLGKDIITGKEITLALEDAGKRIPSDKIRKTLRLIISGIRSGGNLAILLEETSENMRSRGFVEKRAASNVLMYVIFIFFAVAVGAPLLFGLSSVLVDVLTQLLAEVPQDQQVSNVPFALSGVTISSTFVFYYALIFVLVSDVLASLVLGLVSKGDERAGFKYVIPIIVISIGVFLGSRILLLRYFGNLFG